jgi:hypothetical protein
LHELHELDYKSAFSQVKTNHFNKSNDSSENNINHSNPINKSPERKNKSNPSFNSTFKSVSINNSPSANSPNLFDQTCYFSPIAPSDYCSINSRNDSLKDKMPESAVDSNEANQLISSPIILNDRKIKEPNSLDCKRLQRAKSLINSNTIKQFNSLNRRGSKIYDSSQEFIDHLDKESPFYEGKFATTRHHSLIPSEKKPIDLSPVLKNESLKILDQVHNNTDDDIFTVLGKQYTF